VTLAARRWTFPQDQCLLLPIVNTTTELLAQYVAEHLLDAIKTLGQTPDKVQIEIDEGRGFSAVCQLP